MLPAQEQVPDKRQDDHREADDREHRRALSAPAALVARVEGSSATANGANREVRDECRLILGYAGRSKPTG